MDKLLDRWVKIPTMQRYGLALLIAVVEVGGYFWFFYREQDQQLKTQYAQYQKLENQRAEKQAYIDNLAKYEARLNELQQDLNMARALLPDDADVPQLLAQLGNKARQSGLVIEQFLPKSQTSRDFVEELGFAMSVRGSYHEIGMFIDSVGKLDRIVNVMNLSMTNPSTENQKVVVKGEFTIKTYRFVGGTTQGK